MYKFPPVINGTIDCPECRITNLVDIERCINCGWQNPYTKMSAEMRKSQDDKEGVEWYQLYEKMSAEEQEVLKKKAIKRLEKNNTEQKNNKKLGADESNSPTIEGLANFYNSFTILIFIICIVGIIIGFYFLITQKALFGLAVIGSSLIGFIICGATAVLLDVMHNVRDINRKIK